jgi:MoaA/NifB/PqqE/SkfB family radical SAM enzyme
MVHREIRAMVRYAAERGIRPMICTNGGLWTEDNMRGTRRRRPGQRHHVDRRP